MSETLAAKNQEYWNKSADAIFRDKWVQDHQSQLYGFLKDNVDWLALPRNQTRPAPKKMLDYACGSGIVTRSFFHLFDKCIGMDISDNMVVKYRDTATELGLPESRVMAVQGDLLAPIVEPTKPLLSEDELSGFDLVALSMALHHMEDIELTIKRLSERLRPGGVILIADWATRSDSEHPGLTEQSSHHPAHEHHHHHHPHPHHHNGDIIDPKHPAAYTISHGSFTRDEIFGLFTAAGCGEPSFVLSDKLSEVPGSLSGKMQNFYARATKL